MTVLIFANGVMDDVEWIRPYLGEETAVIAANGGSRHLFKLGYPPHYLIGDVDSIDPEITAWLNENECQIQHYPPEKDETDLELALLFAIEQFDDDILLFGTLGGRLDQTLGNILLLTHPDLLTAEIKLVTPTEQAWLITKSTQINGNIGDLVSLIPLKNDVYMIETIGLQYPLKNEWLTFGPARGISNVMTTPTAHVEIREGILLCVHTVGG